MDKIVNVRATSAVRSVTPPILGTVLNIKMTSGNILNCLCRRAVVEEVFANGTYLKLNLGNYNTYNDPATGGNSCIVGTTPAPLKRPAAATKPPVEEKPITLNLTDRVIIDEQVTIESNDDQVQTNEIICEDSVQYATCDEPETVVETNVPTDESIAPMPVSKPTDQPVATYKNDSKKHGKRN